MSSDIIRSAGGNYDDDLKLRLLYIPLHWLQINLTTRARNKLNSDVSLINLYRISIHRKGSQIINLSSKQARDGWDPDRSNSSIHTYMCVLFVDYWAQIIRFFNADGD